MRKSIPVIAMLLACCGCGSHRHAYQDVSTDSTPQPVDATYVEQLPEQANDEAAKKDHQKYCPYQYH